MKKRLFYGLTMFAMLFTMIAWQYASAELVELENSAEMPEKNIMEAA